ncbi:F-actin capping protein, beta subunit [Metschnikowia bicuspidata]|uniref:F-actin-capping protein subunit beta n=1 Tax=Metschnikowia bicuspidata TaxID=27322 RepID=A0A4P9ZB72_9ASCO|nr:F-actin capping protein, beta subunit [Metschnikowia bicuspidata]
MSENTLDAALDLFRRLSPRHVSDDVQAVCSLLKHNQDSDKLAQDLLASVDTPLKVMHCTQLNKDFLCCDYNRDGDSYRLPYSNNYCPPTGDSDSPYPSASLRSLEIKANESFNIYRDLYYEGAGLSSAYLWDTADDDANGISAGFAGVVLFQKVTEDRKGSWNSIHVFDVERASATEATYKLTTSVILDLENSREGNYLALSGTMTRQVETTQKCSIEGESLEWAHLANLGQLVEKTESNVRNLLQDVYFDKLKDIMLKDLRSLGSVSDKRSEESKQKELIKGLQGL